MPITSSVSAEEGPYITTAGGDFVSGSRASFERNRGRVPGPAGNRKSTPSTPPDVIQPIGGLPGLIAQSPTLVRQVCAVAPQPGVDDDDQRSFARSLSCAMGVDMAHRNAIVPADGPLIQRTWTDFMVKRHGVPRYEPPTRRGERFGGNPDPESIERGYSMAMRSVHKGKVPTTGDVYRALLTECFAWDAERKDQARRALGRMLCGQRDWYDPGERDYIMRTGQEGGMGGPTYGFTVHPFHANRTMDRARTTDGPWLRCNWIPEPTRANEYHQSIFNESSPGNSGALGTGAFGGLRTYMGTGETFAIAPTDAQLGMIVLPFLRLNATLNVSRDLLYDSTERIMETVDYMSYTAIRRGIEQQMLLGNVMPMVNGVIPPAQAPGCLQGAIVAPSTVVAGRTTGQTSNTITAANIDAIWGFIAAPNSRNAVWHCNKQTLVAIDQLNTAGQLPEMYTPQGRGGNEYPLLRGRPIILSEFSPNIGAQGALLCVDWTDYDLAFRTMNPLDSPLSFVIAHPNDVAHEGARGLPPGAIESRMSEHFRWSEDLATFYWKMRLNGRFRWGNVGPILAAAPNGQTQTQTLTGCSPSYGSCTDGQGNLIGAAACMAAG